MFFEQGDRNGRLLAKLEQHDHPSTMISSVVSPLGASVSSLPDLLEAFRQYYSPLYTCVAFGFPSPGSGILAGSIGTWLAFR